MNLNWIPAITREGMIEVDRIMTQDLQIPVELMMEHAGLNLARLSTQLLNTNDFNNIVVIAGSGNNGGGGLVAARRLQNWGIPVKIFLPKGNPKNIIPQQQLRRAIAANIKYTYELAEVGSKEGTLLIDAYIGYNFRGDISPAVESVLEYMRSSSTISLDIPSGVDSTTAENKGKLTPLATLTLAWPKTGLTRLESKSLGKLYLADIGIPKWVYELANLYESEPASKEQINNVYQHFANKSILKIMTENGKWKLE